MRILHQEGNQEKTGNRSEWIEWSEKMRNGWKRKMIVLAGKDETGASHRPVLRFLLPFPSLFLFFCFSSLLRNSKKDSICPRPIRESIIKYGKLGQFFEPEDYNFKH